jgi:hypothetical protein
VVKSTGGIDTCFTGHKEASHNNDQMSIFHQRPLRYFQMKNVILLEVCHTWFIHASTSLISVES